jgi:phage tail protein X
MKYRTKDGDVLDLICHHHYGDAPHSVEKVYAANPGLARHGPVLPSGLIVFLPPADETATKPAVVRLWSKP